MISQRAEEDRSRPAYKRQTLLIADDDPVARVMLETQLSSSFDIVGHARDADEAIALAVEHHPDVAIIDVQMPAGGGLRATREIRAQAPDTAIVVLSADESDGGVREIIAVGAIAYVRKGTLAHELARTLHRSIEAHSARRPRRSSVERACAQAARRRQALPRSSAR